MGSLVWYCRFLAPETSQLNGNKTGHILPFEAPTYSMSNPDEKKSTQSKKHVWLFPSDPYQRYQRLGWTHHASSVDLTSSIFSHASFVDVGACLHWCISIKLPDFHTTCTCQTCEQSADMKEVPTHDYTIRSASMLRCRCEAWREKKSPLPLPKTCWIHDCTCHRVIQLFHKHAMYVSCIPFRFASGIEGINLPIVRAEKNDVVCHSRTGSYPSSCFEFPDQAAILPRRWKSMKVLTNKKHQKTHWTSKTWNIRNDMELHGTIWNHETNQVNTMNESAKKVEIVRFSDETWSQGAEPQPRSSRRPCRSAPEKRFEEFPSFQKSKDAEKFSITHLKHLYDSYMRVVQKRKVEKLQASPLSTATSQYYPHDIKPIPNSTRSGAPAAYRSLV